MEAAGGAEEGAAARTEESAARTEESAARTEEVSAVTAATTSGGRAETAAELKALKLLRGRRSAMFTRACNTAEAHVAQEAAAEELAKRLEAVDEALKAFMKANDDYVEKLEDLDELKDAEEYASRIATRHSEITAKVRRAAREQPDRSIVGESSRGENRFFRSPRGSKAHSRASQASRASIASKGAEIDAEVKALELKQLKARQERERRARLELEEEQRRLEEERKKKEEERREKEDRLEAERLEEEVERSLLRVRLCRAAETDLGWERRNDFEEDDVGEVQEISQPARIQPLDPPRRDDCDPPKKDGYDPSRWLRDLHTERTREVQGLSAFVKSIPKLSLPKFSGRAQEWPKWIGLFKALVHDQPSLSDSERMAHLQNAVEGPAAQAVEGMLFNGALYSEALNTLHERFGRDEDIIQAHLRSIFAMAPPELANLPAMEKFYAVLHNTVTVLRNLGYESDLASSENLRRVVEKLPSDMRREWGKEVFDLRPQRPTLEALCEWLKVQVSILSFSNASSGPAERKRGTNSAREGATRKSALTTGVKHTAEDSKAPPPLHCVACQEDGHGAAGCSVFRAQDLDERLKTVHAAGLCFSCLGKGHWSRRCPSTKRCGKEGCTGSHHPLLHGARQQSRTRGTEPATTREEHKPFVASSRSAENDTLLQIVKVRLHGPLITKDVRALLDPGAQTSLCNGNILQQLGVSGERRQLCLQNVEGSGAQKQSERLQLTISGLGADAKREKIIIPEVWSVPFLNVTASTITKEQLGACKHLRGLDLPQYDGGEVELLLGANVIEGVLQREVRTGRQNQPVAVKTDFGWALTGSVSAMVPSSMRQVMFVRQQQLAEEDDLSALVRDWWTTEAFGTKYQGTTPRSQEDDTAFSLLQKNTVKREGRYETGLLWKDENPTFPDNRKQALHRLQATERKLKRQPKVAEAYQETIAGYVNEGHARKLTLEEAEKPNDRRWFLPHHAVTSPNKPGKVRVVFDAAAVHKGVSLNEKLLTGPDLLQSLPGVLLRFREGPIAVAADIKQMYHQIRIQERDQPATSFLWRDLDDRRQPDVYQMQVAIFGSRSSPAIANYVLRRTLEEHWLEPETAENPGYARVQRSFYMDDFLHSETDETSIKKLKQETAMSLAEGGFQLTKWRSNKREVLDGTPPSEKASLDGVLCLGASPTAADKTLGVVWDEHADTLGFRLRDEDRPCTKRGVLSRAASVFDPLGIAAPFTVRARIMMQRLWSRKLTWDEPLPEPELTLWKNWLAEAEDLSRINISRCVVSDGDVRSRQLHVFCDASEDAFGAVVYLRSTTQDGSHQTRFLIAKNRVAPLKPLSIVRLELQGALLGARLADAVMKELNQKPDVTIYWTDSSVVLQYLANDSRRFQSFVANRVAEVKELTARGFWRHVPGKLNPADDCSRGLAVADMTSYSRWLKGPGFLDQDEEDWPAQIKAPALTPDLEGVKAALMVNAVTATIQIIPDPERFSSWLKYRRVVAWLRRFIHNSRAATRRGGLLTSQEMREAEVWILRHVQTVSYPEEVKNLAQGRPIALNSSLLPLSPYRDENGLLRVGGRLENAPLPETARHPVVLPRQGAVTRLIVMHQHIKSCHAGTEHTLNEVRQNYWIVKGRAAVKQLLRDCSFCRRQRAAPKPPRMASLPAARFDSRRPFSSIGIDAFGPLSVKHFRRTEKRYGLLATCMATRAVHLEVMFSLDTDSCIMALRRLFSRRGKPSAIFSDNGTNFVGSCRELRAELRAMEKDIGEKLGALEVEWHFNPPAASHMGGVWERMVRSVKSALRVVLGPQTLTDEVLLTVFAEVEHTINSRPLTHVSSEATDPEALTPNHFLLGQKNPHLTPGIVRDRDLCSRRRWRRAQAVSESVWKRWTKQYLPTLIQRSKWRQEARNLEVGDLVLMAESNLSRGSWPLACITRVFRAPDGRVRSAELRTAGGRLYTRPAAKICFLEEDCETRA